MKLSIITSSLIALSAVAVAAPFRGSVQPTDPRSPLDVLKREPEPLGQTNGFGAKFQGGNSRHSKREVEEDDASAVLNSPIDVLKREPEPLGQTNGFGAKFQGGNSRHSKREVEEDDASAVLNSPIDVLKREPEPLGQTNGFGAKFQGGNSRHSKREVEEASTMTRRDNHRQGNGFGQPNFNFKHGGQGNGFGQPQRHQEQHQQQQHQQQQQHHQQQDQVNRFSNSNNSDELKIFINDGPGIPFSFGQISVLNSNGRPITKISVTAGHCYAISKKAGPRPVILIDAPFSQGHDFIANGNSDAADLMDGGNFWCLPVPISA